MKKWIGVGMVISGMATTMCAQVDVTTMAYEGFYMSGKLASWSIEGKVTARTPGGRVTGISKTSGTGGSVAAGYRINPYFRGEAEIAYAVSADNQDQLPMIMGQFYGDYPIEDTPLMPYIGVGFGGSWYKDEDFSDYLNTGCYSISLGCAFAVTERLSFDVSYRYLQTGTFKGKMRDGTSLNFKLRANAFVAGVQYNF